MWNVPHKTDDVFYSTIKKEVYERHVCTTQFGVHMDMSDRQSRAKGVLPYGIFTVYLQSGRCASLLGPIDRRLGGGRSANYTEAQGTDFDHVRRSRLFVSASFTCRLSPPLSSPFRVSSLAHHECLQGAVSKNL